jgi:hypothetical protein
MQEDRGTQGKGRCGPNLKSLCLLRVLCDSVVSFCLAFIHHRVTENTEVSQRKKQKIEQF